LFSHGAESMVTALLWRTWPEPRPEGS
jgi:hypothetical protein